MARGERVRFMTLTDGTGGELDARDFYEAWNRLRTRLRKERLLAEYAAVIETTEAGALHMHALTTGRYIPQARLSEMADKAGLGVITHIRAVRRGEGKGDDDKKSAAYVSKELAGYVSKQKTEALRAKTAQRRRPFRCSRGWGFTMAEAEGLVAQAWADEREGGEVDPGPWVLVYRRADGSVLLRGRALEDAD